jgi:hypothetical protein
MWVFSLGHITEIQIEEGKPLFFVAIDRTSKLAYAQLIEFVSYKIHAISTDDGIQFINHRASTVAIVTPFDRVCQILGIAHGLSKTMI